MSWQIDKARFNHDCLKNQFLTASGKLIRILRGDVVEEGYISYFTSTILPSWLKHREQTLKLLGRFEKEMSPAFFFDLEPLSRITLQERQWMAELIHDHWSLSLGLPELMARTSEAISAIDTQYEVLNRRLTEAPELLNQPMTWRHSPDDENLVQCAEIFYQRCYYLSDLLSRFPTNSGFGW
jgi:hypothetical protein